MTDSVQRFLEAIEVGDGNRLCSPPGLGGLWRVRHIRTGLVRRVLVRTPEGIVFARIKSHGICENCSRSKDAICDHCNCIGCVWQREVDERSSPLVSRDRVQALAARLKTFQIGHKQVVGLADD